MITTVILLDRHPSLDLIELNILNRYLEVTDMQDFTKASKRDIETKQVVSNITAGTKIDLAEMPNLPNPPETSFIEARLNKDNFWNLMFFLGMFTGISTAFATGIMILSWFTIAGIIWLVKRNSDITFDKEKLEFVINDNKNIKASGAELMLVMFLALGIMAIGGFILDALKIDDSPLILAIVMSLLILVPTLYCILRNYPIAVYFKKEAWVRDNNNYSEEFPSRSHKNWLWYNVWYKR